MISIQGKGVSSGVGVGPLYFYHRTKTEIPRYTVTDPDAEWHRFKGAQTAAIEQLGELAEKASADFAAYREQVEGERREARVSDLVKDGKVKPADKEKVLTFAAALASQGGSVDFAAPDGKSETISLEERYLRELEARPRDQRFAEFSTPPAHAGNDQPEWTPDDMVSKM